MILALHASSVTSRFGVLWSALLPISVRMFMSVDHTACTECKDAGGYFRCFVYLCVCLLEITMSCAKVAELIKIQFGMWTLVDPRIHVLGGNSDLPRKRGKCMACPFDAAFHHNALTPVHCIFPAMLICG